MTTFDRLMDGINTKRERERASDRAIAKMTGQTVAEFDADTTAPDEREECTDCAWFSPEPGHFTGARCQAPKCTNSLNRELWCQFCEVYQ